MCGRLVPAPVASQNENPELMIQGKHCSFSLTTQGTRPFFFLTLLDPSLLYNPGFLAANSPTSSQVDLSFSPAMASSSSTFSSLYEFFLTAFTWDLKIPLGSKEPSSLILGLCAALLSGCRPCFLLCGCVAHGSRYPIAMFP